MGNLTAAGYTVIQSKLCGFDKGSKSDAFPTSYKGMAAAPDIARNLNRSVVGIHAADILRVSAWAKTQYGKGPIATVATGQLHSAALHAALLEPTATGAIASIANAASYEEIATSLLYTQNAEWSHIFNVLAHYDLPDLHATLASLSPPVPQIILEPVDSQDRPLSLAAAEPTFAFAAKTAERAHANFMVSVQPVGGTGLALLDFLESLPGVLHV